MKNCHACFELRGLNIHDDAAGKPRYETILKSLDFLRLTIAGHNDLAPAVAQLVEHLEKLRLCLQLSGEELNIVDEQYVNSIIFFTELIRIFFADGTDEFVREIHAGDIEHALIGMICEDLMTDRVHQMCFAEPHTAVNEERIVGRQSRCLCDGFCHGIGKLI